MRAAIYCRVSTEDQEREGTSLQTQLKGCLDYCQDKGYDTGYRFSEAYSGLKLERPKLNELRDLVRSGQIDVIVVYCLDRLSRDPTHGVIVTQELEKHGVKLETVTEDVDNSELGKLITYIRGFASKLEAEKIRERTMRGKRAKAIEGKIPHGGFARLYGYNYDRIEKKRVVNETESYWVKRIYEWLVSDGLSTNAITYQLRELNAPTKHSQYWNRSSVMAILKNVAYTGKTFAFTTYQGKSIRKPQNEWIEIPGATPAIITDEMFQAAQEQLKLNYQKAKRNMKQQYLLRGHVFCQQCGRRFRGHFQRVQRKNTVAETRRYQCAGTQKIVSPVNRCTNKSWKADDLEALVWEQIERVLDNPELIITEVEKQRQDVDKEGVLEAELRQVERQLRALDREQKELLDNALRGFPESLIITENKKINGKRESLKAQKAELETKINASQEAAISLPKLEHFIELLRQKLTMLDFDAKRMALDMLNIKVWLDGNNVELTGVIPVMDDAIVTTQS